MNKIEPWESAADPEGRDDEYNKAIYFGCICQWKFDNCIGRGGAHVVSTELGYCPYHYRENFP